MDKHQILSQISEILEIAHLQTREFVLNPEKYSAIEVDLMKDYLRIAYDKLNVLSYLITTEIVETGNTEMPTKTETPIAPEPPADTTVITEQPQNEDDTKNKSSFDVIEPIIQPIATKTENNENTETLQQKSTETEGNNQLNLSWEPSKEDEAAVFETEFETENEAPPVQHTPTPISQIIAETFHENKNTFIEKMEKEITDNSILSKVSKIHIDDLKKAIGINDRFLFINELFKGNISSYNQFIEELDKFDDSLKAWEYMEKMRSKKSWDSTSSAYKRLFDIVERKFL